VKRQTEKNAEQTIIRNDGVNSRYRKKEKDIEAKIGERFINYLIGKYAKIRYKIWMLRKESSESKLHLQDLRRICLEHLSSVTSPLALISQIQCSGGSFLSQLFDGHPELHVHPHELMIGYPEKGIWPRIDLSDGPERWFEVLFEDIVSEYNREGYKLEKEDKETFPFVFISSLQREIFLNYIDSVQAMTRRDIWDAYMTSYFGAWLNNQNYYGSKKFITAYMPRLEIMKENMESFFEVYPDGRLISVIRDPKSWFPSARKRWPDSHTDVGQALSEWNKSAQAMLWNKEKYGDCVCLIQFEDLISKTEAAMRFLTEFLTVEFDDFLLTPTFNKFPIRANTSFKVKDQGNLNSLLSTENTLTEHEVETIEQETSEIYSLVLRESVDIE
jgi:hypothetical protein